MGVLFLEKKISMNYFLRISFLFFSFFSLLIFISCAKPNYQEIPSSPDDSDYQEIPSSPDDSNYQEIPTSPENSKNPSVDDSQKPITVEKPKACSFLLRKENLCVSLKWIQIPTQKEYGSFNLSFESLKPNSAPGEDILGPLLQKLSIVLWMPSMGHGSVPVAISPINKTSLSVTHVFFIMPGDWEIRVQIKEGAQQINEQVIFKLSI